MEMKESILKYNIFFNYMKKTNPSKMILMVSIAINAFFIIFTAIVVFGNTFDFTLFQKSIPNVCASSLSSAEKAKAEATGDADIASAQKNYDTIKSFCDLVVE